MPDKLSFSKTFLALENVIRLTQQRNALIAGNITNSDTPGYRTKDIDFKAALDRALETKNKVNLDTTSPGHLSVGMDAHNDVEPFEEYGEWNGLNWVSIDKELTKLTQNNLVYKAAVENLLRKISILKEVIKEGGR